MKRILAVALAAGLWAPMASADGGFGDALNAVRAQAGLGALRADRRLAAAAQAYAEQMARSGHVQHVGADGSTQITRAQGAGCGTRFVGENIAWGQRSAQATFEGWMASRGHRANMLHPQYGIFGLGQSGGMWVIMFADRC
jgi:uncharacterized protein YkwD